MIDLSQNEVSPVECFLQAEPICLVHAKRFLVYLMRLCNLFISFFLVWMWGGVG